MGSFFFIAKILHILSGSKRKGGNNMNELDLQNFQTESPRF